MRIIACALVLLPALGFGQVSFDPVNTTDEWNLRAGGGLSLSEVEYEADGDDFDADRTILSAEFAKSVVPYLDAFGFFGLTLDGELDGNGDVEDGSGFSFGLGARGLGYKQDRMGVAWHGLFTYIQEKYDGNGVEVELDVMEIQGGATFTYKVNRMFEPYGGGGLVIISNGDIETSIDGGGGSISDDVEREDILRLYGGATISFNDAYLRPELVLLGEQTIAFSGGFIF